jgi:CRISPR-associated endonuclease/helicase Cas3
MKNFEQAFELLSGHLPFPWQQALYERFVSERPDNIPLSCDLPTGLGKTSIIAIWLIALANHPDKLPRRLVYVVNRRTVVDQTTDEVTKIRNNLQQAGIDKSLRDLCAAPLSENDPALAISTLRGQFADNREWSADPCRPAVICGTVDMIGSRLLFSGYGCGFKSKPLHAGFLGQDVLLVHDEAHLEPAFQKLLEAIKEEQTRCKEFGAFHVVELSATSRGEGDIFKLTAEDENHAVVQQRLAAHKAIVLHELHDEKQLPDLIADLALKHRSSKRAILVFVRTVDAVEKVREKLHKAKIAPETIEVLTGTKRGLERDRLVETEIFARFLSKGEPREFEETVYLICTSAGEVGVNISADHLVCDLSTFESMAQRFGRVNRFGERADSQIDIVHVSGLPSEQDLAEERTKERKKQKDSVFVDGARRRTLELLQELAGDGSLNALRRLDKSQRIAAFAPVPEIPQTSEILFDAWAFTTIVGKFPGRPPVDEYLHGKSERELPQTAVAWREEVAILTPDQFSEMDLAELLDDYYPLKPHEILKDRTDRVFKQLEKIAKRSEKQAKSSDRDVSVPVWIIDRAESLHVKTLGEVLATDKENLAGVTLLLPPDVGGLQNGFLDGDSDRASDVSDEWFTDRENKHKRRTRSWDKDAVPEEMRLVRRIDFPANDDEDAEPRSWNWYVRPASADDDGSKSAKRCITLAHHTDDVANQAKRIVAALSLPLELQQAVTVAASCHDLGKHRVVWQRSIGNPKPNEEFYAKSGKGWKPQEITGYRHEFGSLLDLQSSNEFQALADKPDVQELILHFVATHHGRGRPHFPLEEAFDLEPCGRDEAAMAREVPLRFARLQRKFGRWGLAYLESLLRAADIAASINPTEAPE